LPNPNNSSFAAPFRKVHKSLNWGGDLENLKEEK
jgi:hypothetical protein